MGPLRVAGMVIIAGFILFVANMVITPPHLYQETGIDVQLGIIASYSTRWRLAQWTGGIAPVVTAIGFVLVSFVLPHSSNRRLLSLGGTAFSFAGLISLLYAYRVIADPRTYFESSGMTPLAAVLVFCLATAGVLYGIAFLQTHLPTWLGYSMISSAALMPLMLVIKSDTSYVLLILFYVVTLVAGIVLLNQRELRTKK